MLEDNNILKGNRNIIISKTKWTLFKTISIFAIMSHKNNKNIVCFLPFECTIKSSIKARYFITENIFLCFKNDKAYMATKKVPYGVIKK